MEKYMRTCQPEYSPPYPSRSTRTPLLATFFCWLPRVCWLHCVFKCGLLAWLFGVSKYPLIGYFFEPMISRCMYFIHANPKGGSLPTSSCIFFLLAIACMLARVRVQKNRQTQTKNLSGCV